MKDPVQGTLMEHQVKNLQVRIVGRPGTQKRNHRRLQVDRILGAQKTIRNRPTSACQTAISSGAVELDLEKIHRVGSVASRFKRHLLVSIHYGLDNSLQATSTSALNPQSGWIDCSGDTQYYIHRLVLPESKMGPGHGRLGRGRPGFRGWIV